MIAGNAYGQIPVTSKTLAAETGREATPAAGTDPTDSVGASLAAAAARPLSAHCDSVFKSERKTNKEFQSLGCGWWWVPLETSAQVDEYFGDFSAGGSVAATFGSDAAALHTELLSDNLWLTAMGLGYVRVGLTGQLAQSDSSAGEDGEGGKTGGPTAQQFFQAGGNANLYFTRPVAVWINVIADTAGAAQGPLRRFDSFVTLSTGLDVPELNAAIDTKSGHVQLGVQGVFTQRTHHADFRFFLQGSVNGVRGFSDAFYRNFAGPDAKIPDAGVLVWRGVAGVVLARSIHIGVSAGVSSMRVKQPARLTIQILDREDETKSARTNR